MDTHKDCRGVPIAVNTIVCIESADHPLWKKHLAGTTGTVLQTDSALVDDFPIMVRTTFGIILFKPEELTVGEYVTVFQPKVMLN